MATPTTLRLRIVSPNQPVKEIALNWLAVMPAQPGTTYSVVDLATQKPASGIVLKKVGDALVVELDKEPVAQIDHFYNDHAAVPVNQQASFDVGSSAAGGQTHLITQADPAASGSHIVWPQDSSAGAVHVADADATGISAEGILGGLGLLGLAIASGGSSAAAAPTGFANAVQVAVVGGPVLPTNGLHVNIYKADGTFLTQATLSANGHMTLNVGEYRGVIIAKVAHDTNLTNADYLDEATGVGKALGVDLFAMGEITGTNQTLTLNLNLLSTLAYHKALATAGVDPLAGTGALDSATVANTNTAIAHAFGLTDINTPVVTTNGTTTYNAADGFSAGETYGNILAALSGADANNGGNSQTTLNNLLAGVTVTGATAALDATAQAEVVTGGAAVPGLSSGGATFTLVDTIAPTTTVSAVHLSADTGTSSSDYITQTAAQTVTATLSAALVTGVEKLYGSVDGGTTWVDITSMVTGTAISWTGVTLAGSSGLKFKVTDSANNDGTIATQAYTLDTTAPSTTISAVHISADTGTSATDFLTKTAAQTITATLSAGLATGDILYGSTDGGTTWVDVTSMVSGTAISWTGAALAGSSSIVFKVTDAAGNTGANTGSTAYVLDTTAPTTTISAVHISADTGTSASDFVTNTTAQTITGTLSAGLVTGEVLYGSTDNGVTWVDVTSMVSGTAISWTGATLSGSSNIQFKVSDAAGNSGTASTQAYVLDTIAPTTTISAVHISADTGTSATDFLTNAAAQTITGTLGAGLATGDILYGSTDGGTTWVDVTSMVSGTGITWTGATLAGSSSIVFKVTDAAGNTGANTGSTAYVLDTTAPSTTISAVHIIADTGTSATDFLTNAAAQTITGTLSAGLATGDILYGSTDGGTTWVDVTSMVSGTAISWTGAALAGSSSIVFKVTDAAGNTGANTGSTAYVLDTTAPTTTISAVHISADTGTSASDFVTNTTAQTITGTLSAGLVTGEVLYGSTDNGVTWIDVTSMVSGTAISWTGASLSGSSNIQFKVSDAAGNSGTASTQAYVLDTTAPAQSISGVHISVDNGPSTTDFTTSIAAQTITATLNAGLATGDILYGSLDGGSTWTNITSMVSGTGITWTGATLVGSNHIDFKITDAAGNTGSTTLGDQAYVVHTPPSLTVSAVHISADTGTSATDFLTNTASQTITGTLSTGLATGEVLYGSTDNGVTWVDVTSMVSGTGITWTGATLAGSSSIVFKVTDSAVYDSPNSGTTAYTLDTTAPAQTISGVHISVDNGTNTTDFITSTAVQTVTATLSAGLATGDILYGSLDGGITWTNITSMVSGTGITWTGAALSGSNHIDFKITDAAGNTGSTTLGDQAYVVHTPPAETVSAVHISVDTGSLSSDFLTNTASQTVTGTLDTGLAVGEVLYGSTDNGATWTDIHTSVSGTSISWAGATLHTGADHILFKVTDSLGFDSATTGSTAYTLDTAAPTASTTSTSIASSANAVVQSTEVGTAYLVSDNVTVNSLADITGAAGSAWNSVAIATANSDTNLAATGLGAGSYHVYTVDAAGNLSAQSGSAITVSAAPSYTSVIVAKGNIGGATNVATVGNWIDVNADGALTAADQTGGAYTAAVFTTGGNADLAGATPVTITYFDKPVTGLNLTGFSANDKINFDLHQLITYEGGSGRSQFAANTHLVMAAGRANASGVVTGPNGVCKTYYHGPHSQYINGSVGQNTSLSGGYGFFVGQGVPTHHAAVWGDAAIGATKLSAVWANRYIRWSLANHLTINVATQVDFIHPI